MPGHVFILRGDIRHLACDAWLMPCDSRARAPRFLPEGLGEEVHWPPPPPEFANLQLRVLEAPKWAGDPRHAWLVNVSFDRRSDQSEEEFYRQSVSQALRTVFASLAGSYRPLNRREVPLVAMPLLGGGAGMPTVELGRTLRSLLEIVHEELRRIDRTVDVALVTVGARMQAAAQHERERFADGAWAGLDKDDRDQAARLAGQAAAGNLALFMGAGTGVGAGLPTWNELLGKLADGIDEKLRSSLLDNHRNVMDQASYLQNHLGGPTQLQEKVIATIRECGRYYSLTHALVAGLPVREAITTNYDQLFETAWERAAIEPSPVPPGYRVAASTSVIPHPIRADAHRWLLKLHGCVTQPESIVLTRESYIRYNHQYAALEGILQATMLTRHMLFVGFSLRDDNFIRILDAVRRVVRPQTAPAGDASVSRPFGSALMMGKDGVMENLYARDLNRISLSPDEELAMDGPGFSRSGRKQELFLDYLLSRTKATAHLLGDDFASLLGEPEQLLRAALQPLVKLVGADAGTDSALARVRAFLEEFGWTP